MSERPAGITILTILASINCVAEFIYAFMLSGSWVFSGTPLAMIFFLPPVLHFVLAYVLWMRVRWAWTLAFVLDIVFITLSVISLVTSGVVLMIVYPLAILMYSVSFRLGLEVDLRVFAIIGVVIGVFFIWYLMQSYVKASFTKAPSTTATKQ